MHFKFVFRKLIIDLCLKTIMYYLVLLEALNLKNKKNNNDLIMNDNFFWIRTKNNNINNNELKCIFYPCKQFNNPFQCMFIELF